MLWVYEKVYLPDVFSAEFLALPERFPPLSERLRNRSAGQLRSMLSVTGEYSRYSRRDDMILRELLRRGLTVEEFGALLIPAHAVDFRVRLRAVSMARAMVGLGKIPQLETLVSATLASLDPTVPKSVLAAEDLLSELRRNEEINLLGTACHLLDQKRFVDPALDYIAVRGHNPADETCVRNANLGPAFDAHRDVVLRIMRGQRLLQH